MELIWEKISSYITSDNIALLSVIITVLIFVLTRRAELRYKKHDDKKVQYLKLISLMEKTLAKVKKDKKGNIILTDEVKHQFFDTGSSLLLYGSKKIYRQYVFFRVFTTKRPSQVLCKPPEWCRIEAPRRRFTIWPERIAPRKKIPAERRSVSCCSWQTSGAWMTSRICSRRPLPNL